MVRFIHLVKPASCVLFLLLPAVRLCAEETNLEVLIFPYLPDAESAAEQLEEAFEAHAKEKHFDIDLDIVLSDTYDSGVEQALDYDISEIDLSMLDALRKDGRLPLDEIPPGIVDNKTQWVGPAKAAMSTPASRNILPHWVCGSFFIHWSDDPQLENAQTFQQIVDALEPKNGRYLFADLWGGNTLGDYYADALIDLYGPAHARDAIIKLADMPENQVADNLDKKAVEVLRALTVKMHPDHRAQRESLHDLAFVYPRAFAIEPDSALIGFSERAYFVERVFQEQPWAERSIPIDAGKLSVKQFPFGDKSQGMPTYVDAFIIPKGRLNPKKEAIALFLKYVSSDEGYEAFLEPRRYYPSAYLLPASEKTYRSKFVKKKMPVLEEYRSVIDDSFPVLDHRLYVGFDKAGSALEKILK